MNLKTTLTLLVLLIAGGVGWLVYSRLQPAPSAGATLAILEQQLTPDQITRVEVAHGDQHFVLEKTGKDWSMPGGWPVRAPEVRQFIDTLGALRSRFAVIPLGAAPNLKQYGLDHPVLVNVRAGGKEYKLALGEEAGGAGNRFSRPTYVRLNDEPEVVRLAPGLVAQFDRPQEYYMQRRLFPVERVAQEKDEGPAEKVDQLLAKTITVKGPASAYTLARTGPDWRIQKPVADRPEPEKLRQILADLLDLWAERFVPAGTKTPDAFGLKAPTQTLSVTRPDGGTVTLLVGASFKKERKVRKMVPGPIPQMPPRQVEQTVQEEYRYARLKDNDQVFEIKGDRLKDLFVPLDSLRDPDLARFRAEDVQRVEVREGGRDLAFLKDKDGWRMVKPLTVPAEGPKVTELLDKLARLQARDQDVIDKGDPKVYGLDRPAFVKLHLEEGKAKKARQIVFDLGKDDTEKKKLYIQVVGQERINAVADDLAKLVRRPALAYRGRRVLDLNENDLARIDVRRGADSFTLEQGKSNWRLTAPVQADVDTMKADRLARELARLEAAEFITDAPKKEDLAKVYGLAEPALTIKVALRDPGKKAPTLQVGKQRAGKEEHYARLEGDPTVFVLRKDAFEVLDREALAYRPLELWQLPATDVAQIQVGGSRAEYTLKREGTTWKVSGPFAATADPSAVQPLTEALAAPRAERYTANNAKDLALYGLDRPYLRLVVRPGATKDKAKEHVLLVGKETGKDTKARYAMLGDGAAIFVVGDKLLAAVDHTALDLLDRKLLALAPAAVERVQATGSAGPYTLERDKDQWRVVASPAPPFAADEVAVEETLHAWTDLKAQRFAAYGDKLDLKPYGLAKPAGTVTVTARGDDKTKAVKHTLDLGAPVAGGKGERYARLDSGPAVVVLDRPTAEAVGRTYLDFVSRNVLTFDGDKVSGLVRRLDGGVLEIVKRGKDWRIAKPAEQPADRPSVEELIFRLAGLRAQKIAAYPAKDLEPFGLTRPAADVTVRLGDKGKPAEYLLHVGGPADKGAAARFARVDGSDTVFVLAADVAEQLLAAPLAFRDRNLVKVPTPTQATLERGMRKATFAEVDGDWKMTAPVEAEAEGAELQKFVEKVSRLRADRLIAEKAADLKPYGLDRPQVRWRFAADGKDELTFLVGAFAKDGKRAYAQLAKSDLVFLLDEPLTALALAEYRSRTVWPALDAAQVEKVGFGYPKGAFTLEKVDGKWQVAGRPADRVNDAVVSDTLDALARLKADHYVADRPADRKVFGLDPPALTLAVETAAGKRTLLIGRREGGTGGYYAVTAASPDAPVFVLSAEAGQKIVRPVRDFLLVRP